jgi:hypothetical protein
MPRTPAAAGGGAPRSNTTFAPASRGSSTPSVRRRTSATTGSTSWASTSSDEPLFTDLYTAERSQPKVARYLLLDARAQDLYVEWAPVARDVVASLRIEAGRNPYDRNLTDLVGELSTRSQEFRSWWASHNVKLHRTSTKKMHHPIAGELELTGEALELPGDAGLTLITYTVEPASVSAEALQFLANWATRIASGATSDSQ